MTPLPFTFVHVNWELLKLSCLKNQLDVCSFWCKRHVYLRLYLLVLWLQITSLTMLVLIILGWDLFICSEGKVTTFNCNITHSYHKDWILSGITSLRHVLVHPLGITGCLLRKIEKVLSFRQSGTQAGAPGLC